MTEPRNDCWMLNSPRVEVVKPHIPVSLICIDTSDKAHRSEWAIEQCLAKATFADVKLLTNNPSLKHAVKIPKLNGLDGYSEFCIRSLYNYVKTSHCLVVQWDGFVLNAAAWTQQFLNWDYIGAPWSDRVVGNGGFSLRSQKLLKATASGLMTTVHPEDAVICRWKKAELEMKFGIKFSPYDLARRFALEGAVCLGRIPTWTGDGRKWNGEFGFHGYLTPLPGVQNRPPVFHHSGDLGDIIYGMAAIKATGQGVLFVSPECRHPWPRVPNLVGRISTNRPEEVNRMASFIEHQDYVWQARYTAAMPASTDVDLNAFRIFYKTRRPENFESLFKLHLRAAGVEWPEDKPWLTVDYPVQVEGRPIVVNRTPRFHNMRFPWRKLIHQWAGKMVFVGLLEEYRNFCSIAPEIEVPYHKTDTIMDLARVIAGAKAFIGNQSSPMAIALGLGKNVIQECWLENSNCLLKRDNAIYCRDETAEIPKEWV